MTEPTVKVLPNTYIIDGYSSYIKISMIKAYITFKQFIILALPGLAN